MFSEMYHSPRDTMAPKLLTGFGGLMLASFIGVCVYKVVRFDQDIGGHLELAATANNIPLAEEQLAVAIAALDTWSICPAPATDCFTSVLYRTPDEDVGFWRQNLSEAHAELEALRRGPALDNLTESNQLIKLRETLMRTSAQGGTKLDHPPGIELYPRNVGYAVWGWLALALTLAGSCWWTLRSLS